MRRPSRCLALRQLRVTWPMERHRHHLRTKTASWRQGVRPLGTTHRVRRPCTKKEAAKKFLDCKRTLRHSSHRRARIVCCSKAPRRLL